jgi:hypothetical protein
MSRNRFSSGPRRGGGFRPQLETLEDRLAPGSLHGTSHLAGNDSGDDGVAGLRRENDELARTAAVRTTSPVVDFADHSIVLPGSSTLTRTEDGISIHLKTSGLTPGHAYTFWWGIVSSPGADLIGGRITGLVVGPNGKAEVSGRLDVGAMVGEPAIPGHEGTLTEQAALHGLIQVVVRDHGPALTGRALFEQLHTFQADTAVNVRVSIHDFR